MLYFLNQSIIIFLNVKDKIKPALQLDLRLRIQENANTFSTSFWDISSTDTERAGRITPSCSLHSAHNDNFFYTDCAREVMIQLCCNFCSCSSCCADLHHTLVVVAVFIARPPVKENAIWYNGNETYNFSLILF